MTGAVAVVVPGIPIAHAAPVVPRTAVTAPAPVISIHLDMPYLDVSGRGIPYRPPIGMRGGQSLAALSEAEFHSLPGM